MRDPYSVLGVTKGASASDIKSAFRNLAKKYHPDANSGDPRAKERFGEISRAYEIVGDEEKRKQFDRGEIDAEGREKAHGYPGGNPFANAEGFEDIFRGRRGAGGGAGMGAEDVLNTMFGGAFGGAHQRGGRDPFGGAGPQVRSAKPQKGADREVRLAISIEEAMKGGKAKVKLPDGRTIAVALPDFLENGTIIRLKGQGDAGPAGHNGDALVKIAIQNTPDLRLEGRNIVANVIVPLQLAITGGKLPIETLDGKIALKIDPWTDSGKVLRIKGRGLPLKSGGRGDFMAVLQVSLADLSDDDRIAVAAHFASKAGTRN